MILDLKISIPDQMDKESLAAYLNFARESADIGDPVGATWFLNFTYLSEAKLLSVEEGSE